MDNFKPALLTLCINNSPPPSQRAFRINTILLNVQCIGLIPQVQQPSISTSSPSSLSSSTSSASSSSTSSAPSSESVMDLTYPNSNADSIGNNICNGTCMYHCDGDTNSGKNGTVADSTEAEMESEPCSNEQLIGRCPICLFSTLQRQPTATKCGHVFCQQCIEEALTYIRKCPICDQRLLKNQLRRIYL